MIGDNFIIYILSEIQTTNKSKMHQDCANHALTKEQPFQLPCFIPGLKYPEIVPWSCKIQFWIRYCEWYGKQPAIVTKSNCQFEPSVYFKILLVAVSSCYWSHDFPKDEQKISLHPILNHSVELNIIHSDIMWLYFGLS